MSKRMKVFLLFFTLFFLVPRIVQAAPPPAEIVNEQIQKLGIDDVQQYWDEVVHQYGGFLPESQKGDFIQFIKGEKKFSLQEWFIAFAKYIFFELLSNGKILGILIMLVIFSSLLQSLQNAFEKSTVSKIADNVVFLVLVVFALNSFYVATQATQDAITVMIDFLRALIPILLALIATSGGVISVGVFHPILIFLMHTSGLLVTYFVLPLILVSTILSIVSIINDELKVTKLASLIRNVAVGVLGIFLTIFLGVLSVQGLTTAVSDGVAVKTAKFVTSNFVPVVGKVFADVTDTVISASLLLKNTVGIVGLVTLLAIVVFPAIKILVLALIYKFSAAILQPVGSKNIISTIDTIGKSVTYLFVCLSIVSLMFFLSMTLIIAAGNIVVMFR
ncbi:MULTISPECIES: stage III sporulation protein AE [Bacillaceae]|uniref:Stage III sporulation protein AE n=1 Tax=Gottfriedia luciferensis TaxID=178774 RepID=A0ABX2ZNI2_9BACI|nr:MULTISPECIES: stage III sporulation protein AE [Bacillaceae]ODG91291.1 stage III sporulation protein AE [Gottfriedia luciferensis]PGZ91962.1 stage III sporulation protein AE [Bacillus sp. AFS029533]SFD55550.1 stage III sporulation protein AE [Bacillus sp. UNCCL81]